MGIVFRQSVKTSIVILSGAILGLVFTYWQTKVMLKTEIGISRNLIYQSVVLQSIVLLGGPSVLLTYIHRYTKIDPRRNVLFSSALLAPLAALLIFCIPYFLLRDWIISKYQLVDQPYLYEFFAWMPILTLLWSYMSVFEIYLMGMMRAAMATFMREVALRLINLALLGLFAFHYISFKAFIIGTIFAYAVPLVILIIAANRDVKIKITFKWSIFEKKEAKEVIHYAWYHLLIGIALNLVVYIDTLMMAPLSKEGTSVLAVYSIAILLVSFVSIPYRAMLSAAFPKLNEAFIHDRKEHLVDLFNRANLNIVIATAFVGVLILCNVHNAVLLLPKGYEALVPLFMILFLGRLIDVSTGLNQEFISITPYYKFTFRAALVYIVIAFVGNRIFIPQYGIYGAAWVSTIGLAIYNVIKAIYLKRKFNLYPFERKGLLIFPIAAIGYGISWLIPHMPNPFIDGIIRTPIVAIVMVLLLLWLKPSQDVKEYWLSIKKKKRLF